MRHVFILVLAFLMVPTALAQFNILSSSQSVSVGGTASLQSYSAGAYATYSSNAIAGSIAGSAYASTPTAYASAASSANLNATITTSQIGFTSEFTTQNDGSAPYGFVTGDYCDATASLSFAVSFTVFSPVLCNLYTSGESSTSSYDELNASQELYLGSASNGVFFSTPFANDDYEGLLFSPGDTYTITVWVHMNALGQEPNNDEEYQNYGFNFTAVPEPSIQSLLGIGLIGFVATRLCRNVRHRV